MKVFKLKFITMEHDKRTDKLYFSTLLFTIAFVYYFLVFKSFIILQISVFNITLLIIIHLAIFFLMWSMITTIIIDPGKTEIFWVG